MQITISEDRTFVTSDAAGNIPAGTELGLYHEDTRLLCEYELTLDGQAPLLLGARASECHAAAHFLANPALPAVPRGQLGLIRRRQLAGHGLHEDLALTNHGDTEAAFSLELSFGADFAHIVEVRRATKVGEQVDRRPAVARVESRPAGQELHFGSGRGDLLPQLVVNLSEQAEAADRRCRFRLRLAPKASWRLCVDVRVLDQDGNGRRSSCPRDGPGGLSERRVGRHAETVRQMPRLETDAYVLQRAYERSVRDFAALQIRGEGIPDGEFCIAAGSPWFVALFGRDALIAAYQALFLCPALAKGVLRALARLQGTRVDRLRAEEPGKILHEHRSGPPLGAEQVIPGFPYYGTIDATPLFLMLLAAVTRQTNDLVFARELRENALRALEWMERYGDRDGDGYLEYVREAEVGLANHGWKDSWDAVRFRDGSIAAPPIALCEVQGYAYAARQGMADVFEALGEPERAGRLRAEALALKARFNRDFWLEERGFYAMALDADKRKVDALTSNAGQLLWTGVADEDKARLVARRLLEPDLFSGWGIRSMAASEGGYSPLSYHNGSVWPHDTSLIVAGLARYGFVDEAARVAEGLLAALAHTPDQRLSELFAGYGRQEADFPVECPLPSRPQAWASGSIFLLLTSMLGLDANLPGLRSQPFLPAEIEHVRLEGVWAGAGPASAAVERAGSGVRADVLGPARRASADRGTPGRPAA